MKKYCLKYLINISILALVFVCLMNAQVTDAIRIRGGWNMVSLPLRVQDAYYLTLFPGAISYPITSPYNEYPDTALRIGKAYWIKFASDTTYLITGEPIQSIMKEVALGWNMVGSVTYPVPVNTIKSDPPGIFFSDYFRYNPDYGYEKSDTIKPGEGYWVKVDQAGLLILTSMSIPCPGIPIVEYAGKYYNTVQVGTQCWLKENLDVGTMIVGTDTAKDNGVIEKYCYNDSIENCDKYGGLYHWNEAMQYTTAVGTQGICPFGWRIPTLEEFRTLSNTVGGDGNVLKAIGQGIPPNGEGTNTSGFSALLAGYRDYDGFFYNLSYYASFWSSTEFGSTLAYYMTLLYNSSFIYLYYFTYKDYGFSVRCVKD